MSNEEWLNWLRTKCDQRFNELVGFAGELNQIELIRQKLDRISIILKGELSTAQHQLILEWEEAVNYQHAIENEWLYLKGIQDGMKIFKALHGFMSG